MSNSLERRKRQIDLNQQLGKHLAKLREELGLRQGQVAEQMGMGRPSISKVENGERRLEAVEIPDYARALGMTSEELMGDIDGIVVEYDGRSDPEIG